MKKYLLLSLAALAVLVSCKKETPQNPTVDPAEGPAPVEFSANIPGMVTAETKSLGALDHWLKASQELYIYGIARVGTGAEADAAAPLNLVRSNDPVAHPKDNGIFIDNVKATFPTAFNDATVTKQPISVFRTGSEPFFYNEDYRYEFFGYYVDDACGYTNTTPNTPNPAVGENDITLPIVINGAQDIMLATTDKDADNMEYGLNPNRLYSAYSSRKGVKPNLVFEHQLSRFNVYVMCKDGLQDNLTLSSFLVETKTAGTLYIARKNHATDKPYLNIPANGDKDTLGIWNGDNGAKKQGTLDGLRRLDNRLTNADDKYTMTPKASWAEPGHPENTDYSKVGTIMVMPGETQYKILVGLQQAGYTLGETFANYTIDFNDILSAADDPKGARPDEGTGVDDKAMPGHQYDVNVVVYGLQEIEITVSMSEWKDAGSFVIDQDNDTEVAIKLEGDTPLAQQYTSASPLDIDYAVSPTFDLGAKASTDPEGQTITYSVPAQCSDIVEVSTAGVITAKKNGSARVIMEVAPINTGTHPRPDGGYRVVYVTVINVTAPVAPTFTFDNSAIGASVGDVTMDLSGRVTNLNPGDATLTWGTANNSGVISVSAAGVLSFLKVGSAQVTVKATKNALDSDTKTIEVTVGQGTPVITATDKEITIGATDGLAIGQSISWGIDGTWDFAQDAALLDAAELSNGRLKVADGVTSAGTATVTISFIPADTTNYTAVADQQITVTIVAS